ncbi:MAG: hypothetical protein C0402_06490 [Thermodesulfovibrio sp.]|nr:hypothetical protein [Thermodesulfovibrio sp.]
MKYAFLIFMGYEACFPAEEEVIMKSSHRDDYPLFPWSSVRAGAFALAFVTCFLLFVPKSFALNVSPVAAPLNPAFVRYQQNLGLRTQEGSLKPQGLPSVRGGGYIPSPVDRSHLKGRSGTAVQTLNRAILPLAILPASYDLRTDNRVTPVKDQGACDAGWAFAAFGSLESVLMPAETWDFSENNLLNENGFGFGHCSGGNGDMATAYLARWAGPVLENDDPYDPDPNASPTGLTTQKHIQEALVIPQRVDALDNDLVKQAITAYGGVMASYFTDPPEFTNYNYSQKCFRDHSYGLPCSYYYPILEFSNHYVTIIGWDDTYPVENFCSPSVLCNPPPLPGAFLAKNSWGTALMGGDGFFYISYYDVNLGMADPSYVFSRAESQDFYNEIYDYDFLGMTAPNIGYSNDTAWISNVFTATASGKPLVAASFHTLALNSAYSLNVYTWNTADTGPIVGEPVFDAPLAGSFLLPGYHTVEFPNAVPMAAGTKFSIVVQLTTPGYNFPIASDDLSADAVAGESFISSNGTDWTDLTSSSPGANVCLKAFAGDTFPVSLDASFEGLSIIVDSVPFTMPQALNWVAGSVHTVNVISPQNDGGGIPYIFISWSDGGAQSHQITAPSSPATLSAVFLPCTQRPAKNVRSSLLYPYVTLQAAYDDAAETLNDDTLLLYSLSPAQSLDLGRDISIVLSGGYNCGFGSMALDPYTSLQALTVSNGTVTVENIILN